MDTKSTFLLVSVVLLSISTSFCNQRYEIPTNKPKAFCINENDNSYINRCHRQIPSNLFTLFSNSIIQWINPRLLAVGIVFVIVLLPLMVTFSPRASSLKGSVKSFYAQHLIWVNFLHRMTFSLMLGVGLYTVFRQSRPCKCTSDSGLTFQHLGSIYGMPSGDAMSAALLGAFIFDIAPFNYYFAKIVGASILPLIAIERISLGFHTFAQTTVGGCLGFALHYYSTRAPQFMIFIDAFVQIIVGTVLINLDPALTTYPDDQNNLMSWLWWGVGFEFMALLLIGRFYCRSGFFKKILYSLNDLTENEKLFDNEKTNQVVEKMVDEFVQKKKNEILKSKKKEAEDEEGGKDDDDIEHQEIRVNRWSDLIYFGDYWVTIIGVVLNVIGALISQGLSQFSITRFF